VVVVDAVKLIESGFADECDAVWLVVCDKAQQVARLMRRNGITRDDAARRIAAQPPLAPKLARADVVLDNSGSPEDLDRQIEGLWAQLTASLRA
jgi:dephospho-CoA kinase